MAEPRRVTTLSPDLARAVRDLVRHEATQRGEVRPGLIPNQRINVRRQKLGRITASAPDDNDIVHHAWQEVRWDFANSVWEVTPDGTTGTTTVNYILNQRFLTVAFPVGSVVLVSRMDDPNTGLSVWAGERFDIETALVTEIDACGGTATVTGDIVVSLVIPAGPCKVNFPVGASIAFIRTSATTGLAIAPDIGEPAFSYDSGTVTSSLPKLSGLDWVNAQTVDGATRDDFAINPISMVVDGVTFCNDPSTARQIEWAGILVTHQFEGDGTSIDGVRKLAFYRDEFHDTIPGTPCPIKWTITEADGTARINAVAMVDLDSVENPPWEPPEGTCPMPCPPDEDGEYVLRATVSDTGATKNVFWELVGECDEV